ncbi:(deoxy)nucleoside triphosphate pyrophosphohydrolase [Acinetobacter sp. B10A]|uniref:(deoxy)nucleoside triphosphate pyrophosphohydrolase n=1 Tax=Acinetobacter baretiae TaxID=2605383 RepID=UPI001B3C6C5C|nr:(deoxy)nucleoside triphosphate pyrophosphohydrolase [Acinetobacter baretiae]MBF7685395.1 (deoxy)nucleoside triphosphate pyrophosphohydrolase [Acinetobacter baretiae]
MKKIVVVAAVIQHEEKILCVQRSSSKYDYISFKYEFPGGKVENNETPEQAIVREIQEELAMQVIVDSHLMTVDYDYPDFSISLNTFLCFSGDKNLQLLEHIDYQWLFVHQLNNLDWAAADLPIVEKLQKNDFK